MKRLLVLAAFAWCAASVVSAQERSVIIVKGYGQAAQTPDTATLGVNLRGEGRTSVEALKALSASRGRVESGWRDLAGATGVEIHAGNLSVEEARGEGCESYRATKLSEGDCAVSGYIATMVLSLTVRPAGRVGDAASLASELGASTVSIGPGSLDDPQKLKLAATAAAVANAKSQAEQIATASGMRLGSILRIQDQMAPTFDKEDETVQWTLPMPAMKPRNTAPTVQLGLTPEPVTESVDLVFTFAVTP